MTDKSLIGIAAGAVVAPISAFIFFGGFSAPPQSPEASRTAETAVATPAAKLPPPPRVVETANGGAAGMAEIKTVTPDVLENLARSVQLSADENEKAGNKKQLWSKAIPVAQSLIDSSDAGCIERNWLKQFVDCGKRAMDNSPDYYVYARSLARTPRETKELATANPSN